MSLVYCVYVTEIMAISYVKYLACLNIIEQNKN